MGWLDIMKILKKSKVLFGLLLLLFVLPCTYAQDNSIELKNTKTMSLEECVNYAMMNSPKILQAKDDIEVSRAKLAEARSGYMPQVGTTVSYSYFNTNNIIKTRLSDEIINIFAEHGVNEELRRTAMTSGINGINPSNTSGYHRNGRISTIVTAKRYNKPGYVSKPSNTG